MIQWFEKWVDGGSNGPSVYETKLMFLYLFRS